MTLNHRSQSGREQTEGNGDGFGISSSYTYEGFAVGAAYTHSDRTVGQQELAKINSINASGKAAEMWVAGLKYDANNIYLAATYAETLNMTHFGNSGRAHILRIKPRTSNLLLNISLISAYARQWHI